MQLRDKTPPTHYRMLIDGSGTPGFVKGEAAVDLAAQGNQAVLTYDADVQVGGLIANVGQRMISGVAKMIVTQALEKTRGGTGAVLRKLRVLLLVTLPSR